MRGATIHNQDPGAHPGFNPRPRAGGDSGHQVVVTVRGCFNPRPRAGGDFDQEQYIDEGLFQSTPPCGGRRDDRLASVTRGVSIHAPVRGATFCRFHLHWGTDVSIHAPVRGATAADGDIVLTPDVSIHAPVRGATTCRNNRQTTYPVSIHAPVRGATQILARIVSNACFNPRPRAGGD